MITSLWLSDLRSFLFSHHLLRKLILSNHLNYPFWWIVGMNNSSVPKNCYRLFLEFLPRWTILARPEKIQFIQVLPFLFLPFCPNFAIWSILGFCLVFSILAFWSKAIFKKKSNCFLINYVIMLPSSSPTILNSHCSLNGLGDSATINPIRLILLRSGWSYHYL